MTSDIERLRRETSLSDLALRFGVALQKNGSEWEGLCPFHQETTPSFTIFPGKDGVERFMCFGCQEHGDVLDFTQKIKAVDLKEAISILGGRADRPNIAPRQNPQARDIYAGIEPLEPKGEIVAGKRIKLWNPKREKFGTITPSMVFPYRRGDGSLIGYVLRNDFTDDAGKARKETPMVMFVRLPDGTETWSRYPFPTPRSLYHLERLTQQGQVIIAEGEKCADIGMAATGRLFMTWPGGTYGVRHTDWAPLAGRSVVIWPDADGPGVKTAGEIATILSGQGCTIKVLDVAGKPDGWDVADATNDGWTKAEIDQFMRDTVRPWAAPEPEPMVEIVAPVEAPPADDWQFDPASIDPMEGYEPDYEAHFLPLERATDEALIEADNAERRAVPASGRKPPSIHFRAWGGDIDALRDWAFLTGDEVFCNIHTGERMKRGAFDLVQENITPLVEMENTKGETKNMKLPASKALISYCDGLVCSTAMYRPDVDAVMAWVDGVLFLNSFLPASMPTVDPDWRANDAWRAANDHIHNIIPDGADAVIKWMAHNVQFPGRKILWAPILVGEQGDGKTTIAKILQMALGRRNVQPVGPEELFSDYTSWAEGVCVRVLEELHVAGNNKSSVVEKLKAPITNDDVPVVGKGEKGKAVPNVTNYMGLTNHLNALQIPEGDRRFGVYKTRFQDRAQVKAELTSEYWTRLHDAINGHPGVMRGWLMSIDLSGFSPFEAPETTVAKREMIHAGRSAAASDITEAIALGGPGVGRDVLDTRMLNDIVKDIGGRSINTTTMSNALRELGWKRVDVTIKWAGKPRRVYYVPGDWCDGLQDGELIAALRKRLDETGQPDSPVDDRHDFW